MDRIVANLFTFYDLLWNFKENLKNNYPECVGMDEKATLEVKARHEASLDAYETIWSRFREIMGVDKS